MTRFIHSLIVLIHQGTIGLVSSLAFLGFVSKFNDGVQTCKVTGHHRSAFTQTLIYPSLLALPHAAWPCC
jgi:hypothetical protein